MTIKLAVLKSGENLISDIKEGYFNEELVCFLLDKPCTIEINGSYRVVGEDNKLSISLKSWPMFSKQTTVEIIKDWIVTLVDPSDEVKEMYTQQVLGEAQNETNQSNLSNEQSDSNQSD